MSCDKSRSRPVLYAVLYPKGDQHDDFVGYCHAELFHRDGKCVWQNDPARIWGGRSFAIHRRLISLARHSFLPFASPFAQHVQINTLYTAISRNHSNDQLHPTYDNQTPPSTEYCYT